jgi:hypothetical protein
VIYPHLNAAYFPTARQGNKGNIEKWAAKVAVPLYTIDDQTVIKVMDRKVEVISEGTWKPFGNRL